MRSQYQDRETAPSKNSRLLIIILFCDLTRKEFRNVRSMLYQPSYLEGQGSIEVVALRSLLRPTEILTGITRLSCSHS